MENEQQSQPAPGIQQDQSADTPPVEPPTPAHEEADRAAPEPDEDNAPDSDEPGDTELPSELQEHVHDGPVPPDTVDQEG